MINTDKTAVEMRATIKNILNEWPEAEFDTAIDTLSDFTEGLLIKLDQVNKRLNNLMENYHHFPRDSVFVIVEDIIKCECTELFPKEEEE